MNRFSTNSIPSVIMEPMIRDQLRTPTRVKTAKNGLAAMLLATLSLAIVPCAALAREAPPHAHVQAHPQSSVPVPRSMQRPIKRGMPIHAHGLTLEQAVAHVQNQTGGKVLKADSRNLGRFTEYRIKVLTPEGHVRVVTLRSDGRGD
jgi:hypothetical protein